MSTPHHEVAVIGASASGLLAALRLAQEGRAVTVYERAPMLDPAPRTLIVTSRMHNYVRDVGDGSVINEINHFEMHAGNEATRVTLKHPDLIVQRSSVIRHLARRAEEHGARFSFGKRLLGLTAAKHAIDLHFGANGTPAHSVTARTVIGADGARSRVATAAQWPQQDCVPLIQAVVRRPSDLPVDTTRIWFRPQETPYFYWLIPESPLRAVLGVISEDGRQMRADLDEFIGSQGLRAYEYQAARIPVYRRWVPVRKAFGGGEVFLVGDAAGQVKVSTVGGLVTGFRGAQGVAHSILGHGERELRRLRRELEAHRLIRKALHVFEEDDYARLLALVDASSARRTVERVPRDQAVRLVVSAAFAQPQLAGMLIRRLFGRPARQVVEAPQRDDYAFEPWPAVSEAGET